MRLSTQHDISFIADILAFFYFPSRHRASQNLSLPGAFMADQRGDGGLHKSQ